MVDDEHRIVELIASDLDDQHVTTVRCFDGPSGLSAARGLDVDAVVLDLMLPGLGGIEVCKQLRREGNDVPILMLTARGAVPERVAGLEAGADGYLVKPFALEELYARLRSIRRRLDPDRPIGTRLVLAVAVTMTAVLLITGGFVFWRVGYAPNRQLDLRPRRLSTGRPARDL